MKIIYSFLLLLLWQPIIQAQSLAWVKTNGVNSFNDEIKPEATAVDANNNVYTLGKFMGTTDFDPGVGVFNLSTAAGAYDIFLQKLDASGNFLWAISLTSTGYSSPTDLKIDANGNAYIAGGFDTPVDFNPGAVSNIISPQGWQDAFILKLNPAGAFQWVHTFGSPTFSTAMQAMAIDNNNNIILSGFYPTTIDFDPGPNVFNLTPTGYVDIFILKLDALGNFIFAKSTSGTDYGDVKDMYVDAANNILITGTYQGTMDFDPGVGIATQTSNLSEDAFILKLNTSGIFSWVKVFGNTNYESTSGIVTDNLNNVYVVGTFSDTLDISFGASPATLVSNGYSDMILLKFSGAGNLIWAKKIGGMYFEQAKAMIIDNNNNLYLTGIFEDLVDFDPGASIHDLTAAGNYDIFISSLDENGNYRMAKRLGDVNEDIGYDLALTNTNSLIGIGTFFDTVDFDPSALISNVTANSVISGDIYNFKWDLCATSSSSLSAYDCSSYTLNGQTYTATGIYTQVLPNAFGCDSLITLSLTIGSTNTTINHTECVNNSYTFNGQTYTSAGTYIQYYTNAATCDSNYIINLSFGTPSSTTFADTACDVYFFGNQVLFNSGTYTNVIPNSSGCDSVITLNLIIHYSVYNSVTVNSCGPYTFNGQTYTMPGTYTNYLVSSLGCDSILDLVLYINSNSATNISQTACKSYTYNGQTYTSSGNYSALYTNMFGCDSTVVLNLTINNANTNITQSGATLSAVASGASYQWINCNGNTSIVGANAQSYTATANGNYAVVVTQNGCTDTSACKTVIGIATQDIDISHSIQVYPNPAHSKLNIDLASDWENYDVLIQSISGQVLYQQNIQHQPHLEIPLSDWAKGIYFLSIHKDQQQWISKFVKE